MSGTPLTLKSPFDIDFSQSGTNDGGAVPVTDSVHQEVVDIGVNTGQEQQKEDSVPGNGSDQKSDAVLDDNLTQTQYTNDEIMGLEIDKVDLNRVPEPLRPHYQVLQDRWHKAVEKEKGADKKFQQAADKRRGATPEEIAAAVEKALDKRINTLAEKRDMESREEYLAKLADTDPVAWQKEMFADLKKTTERQMQAISEQVNRGLRQSEDKRVDDYSARLNQEVVKAFGNSTWIDLVMDHASHVLASQRNEGVFSTPEEIVADFKQRYLNADSLSPIAKNNPDIFNVITGEKIPAKNTPPRVPSRPAVSEGKTYFDSAGKKRIPSIEEVFGDIQRQVNAMASRA